LEENHKTFKYFQENTRPMSSNHSVNAIKIKTLESRFTDFMIPAGMYIANIDGEIKDNEIEENMYTKALQGN